MNKLSFHISVALTASLAFAPPCFAQDSAARPHAQRPTVEAAAFYPDAPSALRMAAADTQDNGGSNNATALRPGEAAPATTDGLGRTFDAPYAIQMGAMFASSIVAVEKTNTCIQQHTCSFVPVAFRSRGALYGAGIPIELGIAYVSYKLKQHGHRWWFVPAFAVTGANSYVAYRAATEPAPVENPQ
ncbi:MAG: hypothetical protein WBV46_05855 [Terriglobales bacterium]